MSVVDYPQAESGEKTQEHKIHRFSSATVLKTQQSDFDKINNAKLLRKLDWHIIPFVSLLYLLSFLDRSNIGNARLAGLENDLGLRGLKYNIAIAVFFPFYILAEVPSNIIFKRTSPSFWLCTIMVVWGTCMTLMGFVKNYTSLLVVRMALGLAEGGLFPGVAYYITLWYKRHETGFRLALFFSAASLAGAFGGLLARGISAMDGIAGRSGWSWIFILEGLVTILVAIAARWAIVDGPDCARFLTEEEKVEVVERLKRDTDDLASEFAPRYVFDALSDWKIWIMGVNLLGNAIPFYSISVFLPTILKNMGYSNEKSQLMSIPPYVFACIGTIAIGYATDIWGQRGRFVVGLNLLAISGFVMLISTQNPAVQYAGTYLAVFGLCPSAAALIAWNSNNIGGSTKRAIGIAIQVSFASAAGLVSAFSFRTADAPRYFSGHGLLIGTITMSTILSIIMHIYFIRENVRRDAKMKAQGLTLSSYTDEMKNHERDKGDNASFFRYTT